MGISDTYALGVLTEATGHASARTGGNLIDSYPWHLALDEAEHLVLAHR